MAAPKGKKAKAAAVAKASKPAVRKRKPAKPAKDKGITTALKARLMKMGALKNHILRQRSRAKQSIAPTKKARASAAAKRKGRMSATKRGEMVHSLVQAWVNRQLLSTGARFTMASISSINNPTYPGISRAARAVARVVLENNLEPTHSELTIGPNKIDMVVRNKLTGQVQIVEIKSKTCSLADFKRRIDKPAPGFSAKQLTSEADQAELQVAAYRRSLKEFMGLAYYPHATIVYAFTTGRTVVRQCSAKFLHIKPQ